MIRLSNPYQSDTKQTPIEMLLARMKQSQQEEARADAVNSENSFLTTASPVGTSTGYTHF